MARRHPNRIQVYACSGRRLYSISEREAESLDKSDPEIVADRSKTGKILSLKLPSPRANAVRVVSTLTMGDMIANAEARDEQRNNRARIKVDRWNEVHDTFAITIVDGKVFTPDPTAAANRAKRLELPNAKNDYAHR
jgi:hypothetical protein